MEASNISVPCVFSNLKDFNGFVRLLFNKNCYRHSFPYGIFLFLSNVLILLFGFVVNLLTIYVVIWKIKKKTASSVYIINQAVADLFVIIGCIPATLISNLFLPWLLGNAMCKAVVYGQGVFVFCSVYSLVALSFDRLRALDVANNMTSRMQINHAIKISAVIWIVGLSIAVPWTLVFEVKMQHPDSNISVNQNETDPMYKLPFCQELWPSKLEELAYFSIVDVVACFVLPLIAIVVCNFVTWRYVGSTSYREDERTQEPNSRLRQVQRQRMLRVLILFTFLTFSFFLFWLPLYLVGGRIKFFYTDDFVGSEQEQEFIETVLPICQLLGTCNSCVNPILYALLNQTFRENFLKVLSCVKCTSVTLNANAVS